jgi:SWI/SNF related-matrix-associated actin-dependent regulator of chromatin subfamily C
MDEAAKEPKKSFNCYSCGIDCARLRFHYAKSDGNANAQQEAKYDLCPNCFVQGRMPSTHRASDFVRLEEPSYTTIPDKDAPWTDSETLLLLEGLENFDDDWASIANHVGTRTREDCVMKFLQLEIQDQYLEDEPSQNSARALDGRQPITQLDNPIMSVVAFMAQMADPNVVAAAAGRSIEAMRTDLRETLEQGMGGPSSKEKDSDKGKAAESQVKPGDDSMDVDPTNTTTTTTIKSPPPTNPPNPPSTTTTTAATTAGTVGLALTAARAAALASHEEREMTRLVGAAVNLTLQKFDLKLQQFSEMEEVVQAERRHLERARQTLFLDRVAFRRRMRDVEDAYCAAGMVGGEEGLRLMKDALGGGSGSGGGGGSEKERFVLGKDGDDNENENEKGDGEDIRPLSADAAADYKILEM